MNGWAAQCARKLGDTAERLALGHLHTTGRTLWAFSTLLNRRCWAVSRSRGSLQPPPLDRSVLHATQDGGCGTVNLSAHARPSTASTACNNASMCEPGNQSTHELGRKGTPEWLD